MTSSESDSDVTKVAWDEDGVTIVAAQAAVVVTSSLSKKDPSFGMGGGFVLTPFTEGDALVYESDAGQGGRWARWAVLIDWLKANPKLGSQIKVRGRATRGRVRREGATRGGDARVRSET